jgi:DNA-binding NarL/FixJ family response regulator
MEYVKKLIELGASGYLTKDCSIEEMIKAILQVNQGGNYICDAIKENVLQRMFEENGTTPTLTSLTDTELQIVNLIKDGMPSKKIAFHLNISLKTVEVHRHNVLNKLDVKNSASLVNFFSTHHIAI